MRPIILGAILCLTLGCGGLYVVKTGVDTPHHYSVGQRSFYVAIADRYDVPQQRVIVVRDRGISDEELPVLFFISYWSAVDPDILVSLRLRGMSWMEIGSRYNIGPAEYYFELPGNPGPPYGRSHGYFREKNRQEWHRIILTDIDIINYVNLRFMSEHYGYEPVKISKMRGSGKSFVDINTNIKSTVKGWKKREKSSKVAKPETDLSESKKTKALKGELKTKGTDGSIDKGKDNDNAKGKSKDIDKGHGKSKDNDHSKGKDIDKGKGKDEDNDNAKGKSKDIDKGKGKDEDKDNAKGKSKDIDKGKGKDEDKDNAKGKSKDKDKDKGKDDDKDNDKEE